MQRKQDRLVSIGEAFGGLDGPVKALAKISPQARHHFTQADQVNQLVGASEADPDLGFMARLMALCSLPRTNPGKQKEYKRVNGPYTLYIIAGGENKLPFGNLPRLLLTWVCTEAVRTQSRELILGRSLSKFMRTLGVYNSGGQPQTRLRNQMKRLFGCTVSLIYKDECGEQFVSSLIAERGEFWWNERKPKRSFTVEQQDRTGREVLPREHPPPGAPRYWCSPDFVDTVKSHAALCRAARSNSAGLR